MEIEKKWGKLWNYLLIKIKKKNANKSFIKEKIKRRLVTLEL